jgi:hypothetical protein
MGDLLTVASIARCVLTLSVINKGVDKHLYKLLNIIDLYHFPKIAIQILSLNPVLRSSQEA